MNGKSSIPVLRTIFVGVIALLVFGFLIDLFSSFYVLRHSKSIYAGLGGLLIVAMFYVMGEAGSDWIGGKDKVNDSLYKRVFRLSAMLIFGALILFAMWLALKHLGLIQD